eukprot:XP_028335746.1 uncharacterized protein LOC114484345 [Physeter catodon]
MLIPHSDGAPGDCGPRLGVGVDKARPRSPALPGLGPLLRSRPASPQEARPQPARRARGRPRRRRPWPAPLQRALPHSPTPRDPRQEPREAQARSEAQPSTGTRRARAEVRRRPCPREAALGGAGGPRSVVPAGAQRHLEAGQRPWAFALSCSGTPSPSLARTSALGSMVAVTREDQSPQGIQRNVC